MEEIKEEIKNESKNLKKEATDTVNKVKNTIKNVDIKKDSLETKGFIVDMFKNPLEKIKEIADKDSSNYFTSAVIILAIWCIAKIIARIFSLSHIWGLSRVGSAILSVVINGITPIISILVMSLIVFIMNKNNKKKLVTVITEVIVAKIPVVIASVVSLLGIFGTRAGILTKPFSDLCNVISVMLMYFAIKSIFGTEKNSDFIKKFIIVQSIFYIAYIILSFFEIYI